MQVTDSLDLSDLSEALYSGKSRSAITQLACYEMSNACRVKPPPVPKVTASAVDSSSAISIQLSCVIITCYMPCIVTSGTQVVLTARIAVSADSTVSMASNAAQPHVYCTIMLFAYSSLFLIGVLFTGPPAGPCAHTNVC
jgi:hypothetical protein